MYSVMHLSTPQSTLFPYTTLFRSPEVVYKDLRAPNFLGDLPHTWVGSDFIRSFLDLLAYERDSDQARSEEHTSELQSRPHLVCRLLLEKKKKLIPIIPLILTLT